MKHNLHFLVILFCISFMMGEFKNVQVLNFETEKELKKYMKSISKDLGVKCTFCHDLNDKSIETDHKTIAREMIIMQNNLNSQNKEDLLIAHFLYSLFTYFLIHLFLLIHF